MSEFPHLKFSSKQEVRELVWKRIEPYSLFPPPYGRIPNFKGAFRACERLRDLEEWKNAKVVFSAPDSPLRRAREICLEDGKILVMAKPHIRGFLIFNPVLNACSFRAGTVRGTLKELMSLGTEIELKDLPEVDIFVQGCVAVDLRGNRIGKGKGYGDREYHMLKPKLYVVVCHDLQVFDDLSYLCDEHDARCDVILTPKRVIRCE